MKIQSLSIDSDVKLWPWDHFISEYLAQFGGLPRMECAALKVYNMVDNQEIEK